MIRSIGSISEHVISHSERKDRGQQKSLSQQLREEKELLFGSPRKRKMKNILPQCQKKKHLMIRFEHPVECEGVLNLILSRYRLENDEHILLEDLRSPKTNRHKHIRMIVCYIAYQCFWIRQKDITDYFDIHRDIVGTSNHMLGRLFENKPNEKQKFLDFFDYFMTLLKREYQ
jgi:hypothetical protein